MDNIELYARTDKNGMILISGLDRFNGFFKNRPDGRFFIQIQHSDPSSTDHHVWYIIKMIVPAFIKGHKEKGELITFKEAIDLIREECPVFEKNNNENYGLFDTDRFKPSTELSKSELEIAIEFLHFYCLENFNICINYKSI